MSRLAGQASREETRIESLDPHPAALLIHRPTEAEYQSLKASIATIGVVNPVITVCEDRCLDGNTRLRACRELGCVDQLRVREFDPATDGDPYQYVEAQNAHRRHLSEEQRIQIDQRVEAAVALREQGLTYGEIADKLGVSQRTVRRLVRLGEGLKGQGGALSESAGQGAEKPTTINKRGQRRPASYSPRTRSKSKTQPGRVKAKSATQAPLTPAHATDEEIEEPETRMGRMTALIVETERRADLIMAGPDRKTTIAEHEQFTNAFMPFMTAMSTHKEQLLKDYHKGRQ
jgi:ParB-like chromosome segregation protein Spo0J